MKKNTCTALVSFANARAIDTEASERWGLHPFSLVEAAGRACADVFLQTFLRKKYCRYKSFVVFSGTGNNAADALVMLRALVLKGRTVPSACTVFLAHDSSARVSAENLFSPPDSAVAAVKALGIPVRVWNDETADDAETTGIFDQADFIIDGIAGTGLNAPLCGTSETRRAALQMVNFLAARASKSANRPLIVSVDVSAGLFDGWRPGMPAVAADVTLAIEPQKLCLYTPAARPFAGKILPVTGIFPPALLKKHGEAELVRWKNASARIEKISPTAYKYTRGLVEIRAGSTGSTGAAKLAALGAQAAGAGLVRLIVDPSLHPLIAPSCYGIMAVKDGVPDSEVASGRFSPSAVLLGPGWGKGEDRKRLLESYLPLEARGLPLILDADAIDLAKDIVFHGNALLTPHPGEFASYTGINKDEILADPVPVLRRFAAEKNVTILFKGHVLYAASPDGRIGIIDGMNPQLASGGTGDVLAGFCASLASRSGVLKNGFDGFVCACAAASLLIQAAKTKTLAGRFADPKELARAAAGIAGKNWLP